mgnify:CR=1 FL=1
MKAKIESNQPIPPRQKARKYLFLDLLSIGQNVLVETEEDAYKVRDAMRYRGMKYTWRKSREGWRIWYIGDK